MYQFHDLIDLLPLHMIHLLYDYGERHMTAFRPISRAARGWSYDD